MSEIESTRRWMAAGLLSLSLAILSLAVVVLFGLTIAVILGLNAIYNAVA
jgi:hypothetical protein